MSALRPPRLGQGRGLAMKVLAISGSLPSRLPQHRAPAGGGGAVPPPVELEIFTASRPSSRMTGTTIVAPVRPAPPLYARRSSRRRRPDCHPRIHSSVPGQLKNPSTGIAALRRQRPLGQAGRGRRRQHRDVRRGLGAGRGPETAAASRARQLTRPPHRACRRSITDDVASPTPSCASLRRDHRRADCALRSRSSRLGAAGRLIRSIGFARR